MNCHACQERANGNQARYTKLYLNLVLLQVIVLISELILKEALDLVLRCLNYRVYHLHKSWTRGKLFYSG